MVFYCVDMVFAEATTFFLYGAMVLIAMPFACCLSSKLLTNMGAAGFAIFVCIVLCYCLICHTKHDCSVPYVGVSLCPALLCHGFTSGQ